MSFTDPAQAYIGVTPAGARNDAQCPVVPFAQLSYQEPTLRGCYVRSYLWAAEQGAAKVCPAVLSEYQAIRAIYGHTQLAGSDLNTAAFNDIQNRLSAAGKLCGTLVEQTKAAAAAVAKSKLAAASAQEEALKKAQAAAKPRPSTPVTPPTQTASASIAPWAIGALILYLLLKK